MREIEYKGTKSVEYSKFLYFLPFLLALPLSWVPIDNLLWYRLALYGYGLSSILYLLNLFLRSKALGRWATLSLYLSLLLNLIAMGRRTYQTYQMGAFHPPWSNLFEALTFWAFMVGVLYLILELKYHVRLLGALVVPVSFLLSLFADVYAVKEITPLIPALRSYWLYFHVVTAFLGYAGFTVAFGGALLYLVKEKFPNLSFLPSKDLLEEISYKAVVLVFPVWTLSIILGSLWAYEAWGGYWSWDPKEVWSLIVWLFFGAYLHARQMLGWKGKRTSWMLVFGYITVLICFFAINLFFPGLHSYAKD
ncbi:c-type cytochrome biogenesis protein CcsB [Thermocrinis minervae]|uniref:Cytochrome c-type biogenesis protein CcsB n=1 Tax=Thermocrinis minervae TaxID=381751 RepID=A0A1M6S8F5_9AQUI|nr:c-type cytochrome biogenesis protein CcsB [Thermocrinis minervae]SHK41094.1 cytochrome c-type biogenesis protein CcsB [Thermocrinis minervae]